MATNVLPYVDDRGDQPAVVDEFGSITWRKYNALSNRLIHAYRGLGLEVGDAVGLLVGNRLQALVAASANAHAGLVQVPINWHSAPDEVAYVLEDADIRALVVDGEHVELARAAVKLAGRPKIVIAFGDDSADDFVDFDDLLNSQPDDEPEGQSSGSTMFYTSGTTGRPKGVRNTLLAPGQDPAIVQFFLEGLAGLMGYPREGRTLIMAPSYHSGPFATAAVALAVGNTLHLARKFDPEEMLQLIQEHRITALYAVPTFFVRLLKLPEDVRKRYDVSSVEYVWHTAAPCPPDVKKQMMDWWGPVIYEGYGATEGAITCWVGPEEWLSRPGTIGRPTATVELIVLGENGERITEPHQVGELYFRTLIGADFEYHKAPDKTDDVHLEPGVFTFGDIGYFDEDGFVFLSDRKIDMIISGGVNIYPAEIESVLVTHPAVSDVAVFGIPHEDFGEEVKAVVELQAGAEPSDALAGELQQFCRDRVAGYKVPRTIDFADALPRTEAGKLIKRQLRDPYWEGAPRTI